MTNENDQNPSNSTQDVLDSTSEPAQKLQIPMIVVDICYGTASFRTVTASEVKYYPSRPLCDYVSILCESEAYVHGCEANIVFRAPFYGGIWVEAKFREQSVLGSQEKFEKFSQDVHSISHLWKDGRIFLELYNYSDVARAYVSGYDFCEALFGQDRSILKCKVLEINWLNEKFPFSVITNVADHCNQLIFKIKQHTKQKLHHTFLDLLYKTELPQHVDVSVELDYSRCGYNFFRELEERFKRSTGQVHFKFKLVTLGFVRDMMLRNEHGSLEVKTLTSDSERLKTAIIEQCPHTSVPEQQST